MNNFYNLVENRVNKRNVEFSNPNRFKKFQIIKLQGKLNEIIEKTCRYKDLGKPTLSNGI
jgi:hypothetical protein